MLLRLWFSGSRDKESRDVHSWISCAWELSWLSWICGLDVRVVSQQCRSCEGALCGSSYLVDEKLLDHEQRFFNRAGLGLLILVLAWSWS